MEDTEDKHHLPPLSPLWPEAEEIGYRTEGIFGHRFLDVDHV